ncbi:MAG: peptidyl-prolyl cis-trans isomerase [Betaproteobacteria bacterium]|nr:peptidyl-prolyl cis-trans isomerase [Betaproteobacteria bacterium]
MKFVAVAAGLIIASSAWAQAVKVELATNKGVIVLELNADKAPKTVANFVEYVKAGHYDGTVFHRVIDGFMVQGGGFDKDLKQKPARAPIQNEAANGLKNDFGAVAMARTPDPHSASAQFFINVKNNDFLNFRDASPQGFGYAVFGKVVSGLDVVEKITKVPTGNAGGHQNVPRDPIVIEKARVLAK